MPGVQSAVASLEARAYFEGATTAGESFNVLGVDLLREQAVRSYQTSGKAAIDDPLVFLNQPDSIILTKAMAEKLNIGVDAKIRLATTAGVKSFTVRGLLDAQGPARAYGGSLAIMDIDAVQVTFGKLGKIDRIDIVPDEGADLDHLQREITERLGKGYVVERPESQIGKTEKMLATYQVMLAFFSSLALMVGLFLVANTVAITVSERRKEIGTLRAIGASRSAILGSSLPKRSCSARSAQFSGPYSDVSSLRF